MNADKGAWGPGQTAALWVGAYVYGSTPLVYWLGRRARVDLRRAGSGNVGATNLLQQGGQAGKALALAGWLFDASKGALPPALALALGAPPTTAALAGALGTAGQCWPAPLKFQGGRGISAFVGAAALMDPVAWAISLTPMIVGSSWGALSKRQPADHQLARSRAVPLGCFIAVMLFPLACIGRDLRGRSGRVTPFAPIALSAIILLRRLTAALPDDASAGPRRQPRALVYRLLYDRNTRV